jgi:hypothetical protein
MNPAAIIFLLVTAAAMMSLPRRWAPLPLLAGACYITNAQSIEIGPFHFTVVRLLLLLGFIRTLTRKERLSGGLKGMDKLVLYWGAWLLCSSVFHKPFGEALVFRLGVSYSVLGIYFLIRVFCQSTEDLIQIIKITAFILVPVALEMINEKFTGRNYFGLFGGVPLEVMDREGKLRAQGPFGHPILAGTVGGLCVPLMVGLWRQHPRIAKIGLAACLGMVLASNSSGPVMTSVLGVLAVALWRWRRFTPKMRIAAVIVYILCNMIMTRPAYYLLEKIDLTGSSSGYHRAAIIEAGITHLNEWWLGGTDYTRHWMPYGVSWSEDHCDITNHYLYYGVDGGLPLMILLICMLWVGFRYIGGILRLKALAPSSEQFLLWSLGATLFSHTTTMISVAYFDQSGLFLYLTLAIITSMHTEALTESREIMSDASAT